MLKIDKIDVEIVNLLMEDGRMSASEMARRLPGVSERIIRYRMERLIAEGVIRVTAVVNPRALGLMCNADVWLEVEADSILSVAQQAAKLPNVCYVAFSMGERDVSIQVVGRTAEEIYRFVTEVIAKLPGVRKTTTTLVPEVLLDVHQWRIPPDMVETAERG
ncbi:MAG: Lrp/AsnC family transcriptional regulator [Anaerolineales bacterium]|nr:Lrp/AsnC family transcriptional regulator [Anaerolineales bacterium]MCX7609096.1 Lrp/AsnC family transcriptional regulator [Anaerolineales bacterium]MDW8227481.1 Lrp/AsnC family transcriptional regulator [Anaerolineales bacterium]